MSKWMLPGMLVAVTFDPMSQIPNKAAKEYDGTIHRISGRKAYGPHGYMFTLESVESKRGVPYWFTEQDLQPLEGAI